MTSTCPLVTGSNEPGQTARLTMRDRTGAGPPRSGDRGYRSRGVGHSHGSSRLDRSTTTTASSASQPPPARAREHRRGPPRAGWRTAGRPPRGRSGPAGRRRPRWAPIRRPRARPGSPTASTFARSTGSTRGPDSTSTTDARAAGQRLQPQGPGAGVQVQHRRAVEVHERGEAVEQRLAGLVAGGPHARRRDLQPPPAGDAGDQPRHLRPSPGTRRARRWPARPPPSRGRGGRRGPRSVASSAVASVRARAMSSSSSSSDSRRMPERRPDCAAPRTSPSRRVSRSSRASSKPSEVLATAASR